MRSFDGLAGHAVNTIDYSSHLIKASNVRHPNAIRRTEIDDRLHALCEWFFQAGLADRKFRSELRKCHEGNYKQHLSEMLVAKSLATEGWHLSRTKNNSGPDFLATREDQTIQIEVSTPDPLPVVAAYINRSRGSGAYRVPRTEFLLCWTKGIDAKIQQAIGYRDMREGWIHKGNIDPSVPFVIAVNGINFQGDFEDEGFRDITSFPVAIQAVYGVSDLMLYIDTDLKQPDRSGHEARDSIQRPEREGIPTNSLLDPKNALVSAVWTIAQDEYDLLFDEPDPIERQDWRSAVLHNPYAQQPIVPAQLPSFEDIVCTLSEEERVLTRAHCAIPAKR